MPPLLHKHDMHLILAPRYGLDFCLFFLKFYFWNESYKQKSITIHQHDPVHPFFFVGLCQAKAGISFQIHGKVQKGLEKQCSDTVAVA